MPAMNLQIVWSIHVCIKLVWYCLEWKTLQLCGWLLPISCLHSLKRKKQSGECQSKAHCLWQPGTQKCTIQKEKAVVKLLRKLKCCFRKFFSMQRTWSVWNFSHPVNCSPIWSPDVQLTSKQLHASAGRKNLETKISPALWDVTCYDLGGVHPCKENKEF